MVSSDFGKLEVRRHLISGDDCAIAGEATAATAAPVAETFKKSRRFIQASPHCSFLGISGARSRGNAIPRRPTAAPAGVSNTDIRARKRDQGMTALIKRKSNAAKHS